MLVQREADSRRSPGAPDVPITRSFAVWGQDLLGPFKKAPGGLTHLIIMVDKFTKWIQTRPLANIGSRLATISSRASFYV
jgi:hypothetical protein